MANTSVFITAGLPIAKDSGQSPTGGKTSVFITAGLPKVVEVAAGRVRFHPGMSGLHGGGAMTNPGMSGGLNA